MSVISVKNFGGIAPATPPRYLDNNQAQTALNCPVWYGSVQPLRSPGSVGYTLPKTGEIKTIYRFGQDTVSDTQHWFHWNNDVDVCRSQIAGDTHEWTFYTGDGTPKATHSALALTGSNYPAASRPLGLPAPTGALSAVVGGTEDESESVETRVYTYTWVHKEAGREVESAPATASDSVDVRTSQTVTLSGFASVPGGDYMVTHKRIYRSVSGVYLFVAEIPATATTYVDSVDPEDLAEELPSLYWAEPPDDLGGLINLPNGMMAGFVGRDLYFCEPYRPHAWPENYIQTVDYPIVGLGRMDTTLAVLTKGVPYFVQGAHPDSVTVVKSDIEQACVSKRSIVSIGGGVIYAAPDGLMFLSPAGSRILTENVFDRDTWLYDFNPETIHAYRQDNQYIGFYTTRANPASRAGFVLDLHSQKFITHDIPATAAYQDLLQDKLFFTNVDRLLRTWGRDGESKTLTWKSKKFTLTPYSWFSCAQVEAEAYPIDFTVWVDGAEILSHRVTDGDPFRLPAKRGRDWEFQIEGQHEVFSVALATSVEELASV